MSDIKMIIKNALDNSMSYTEYENLFEEYATTGKTTGPNKSEDMVTYTKLNYARSKRIQKTLEINESLTSVFLTIDQPIKFLLITETWCGDAANSVPVIGRIASRYDKISLSLVLRDENLILMDRFLTNGGRSIPKLVILNNDLEVLETWGPRPARAQELYMNWKTDEHRSSFHDFHIRLQKWYNEDKSQSLQKELASKLAIVSQLMK